MKPRTVMVVAGDPSGDASAAELVKSLATAFSGEDAGSVSKDAAARGPSQETRFFGAGGPNLARVGVDLAFDLTGDAVIGPGDLMRKLTLLKRRFDTLASLAVERQPELIILVDFGAFNWRLAREIRARGATIAGGWRPKIVQYISPQVWASRPGRADKMARDLDLLICLLPFEKEWYARRVPQLNVAWAGHPKVEYYANDFHWLRRGMQTNPPTVLILPGSRKAELERHLPVMLGAAALIAQKQPVQFKMVVDSERLAAMARAFKLPGAPDVLPQIGGLAEALASTTVAITKTGTITLECACFGVPAVAIYRTSPITYVLGRCLAQVKYLSMPNLLADEAVFPEFIQNEASAENIASAALELLGDPLRRAKIQEKLAGVVQSLGGAGATARATAAILKLTEIRN